MQNSGSSVQSTGTGDQPPSESGSGGAFSVVSTPLHGLSAVSDSVALTADLSQAYAGFDPTLHATNPDGSPRTKKGGGFALKRGRRAGGANTPAQPMQAVQSPTGETVQVPKISDEQAAILVCQAVEGTCIALLGDEWETQPEEARGLKKATQAYFASTGGMDMSPGTAMFFSWGLGYAMPRISKPKTRERLVAGLKWLFGLTGRK